MAYRKHLDIGTGTELIASEKGTINKRWRGKIPICVVYPNTYHVGMSNLATHILYKTLNTFDKVVCERCFFEEDRPVLSLESKKPLSSFELVFFILSYELDYVNIPSILHASSIHPISRERKEREPIIIAGGICAMSNPEPVASLFDLFILGDIEATISPFMEEYFLIREKKRAEIREALSIFDWIYNPAHLSVSYNQDGTLAQFDPPAFKRKIHTYNGDRLGVSSIITKKTEFSSMFLIEGTRGCPSSCPFCLLGYTYRFLYDRMQHLDTDEKHIGIVGGGVSFHPHLIEIIKALKKKDKTIHLPSLRMDAVPLPVIEIIRDDIKTLTFGIEAGTERLRRFIGKPLTDEDILDRVDKILSIKPFNLKLYFMIGLYSETQEDIDAIADTVKHIKHIMIKKGAKIGAVGSITVHVSPFVPKPATPFQWLPMDDMGLLKEKIGRLKKAFSRIENTYFTHESVKYSAIQGIFSRGDRRIHEMIISLSLNESFFKIQRESVLNPNFYILRERKRDEQFPWDFIIRKESKEKLYQHFKRALFYL